MENRPKPAFPDEMFRKMLANWCRISSQYDPEKKQKTVHETSKGQRKHERSLSCVVEGAAKAAKMAGSQERPRESARREVPSSLYLAEEKTTDISETPEFCDDEEEIGSDDGTPKPTPSCTL